MSQPPIPSPVPEPDEVSPVMTCPYCQHKVELTWGLYWRAPLSKFKCPACRQTVKAKMPGAIWLFIYAPSMSSALVPAAYFFYLSRLFEGALFVWFLAYLLIATLLDRYLTIHFGMLRKVGGKRTLKRD